MNQLIPDIYEYLDFRKYLQDFYIHKKSEDPTFTHSYVCSRLGQDSAKSYFNNVIKSRTTVTPTFIDRFIALLQLKNDQAKYFRALVNYNQATSAEEKEFFFDQVVRLNNTPHRILDTNAYAYYKEWYHSAIRALLDIVDFKDNYKLLAERIYPPISIRQARESVALLKELNIIKENSNGFWKPTDQIVSTNPMVQNAIVEQFQMKCLEHAKNMLVNSGDLSHRNITLTISLSEKAFEQVSERIVQFKSEIRSIVKKDEEPASKVYHINLNIFPMSS